MFQVGDKVKVTTPKIYCLTSDMMVKVGPSSVFEVVYNCGKTSYSIIMCAECYYCVNHMYLSYNSIQDAVLTIMREMKKSQYELKLGCHDLSRMSGFHARFYTESENSNDWTWYNCGHGNTIEEAIIDAYQVQFHQKTPKELAEFYNRES